MSFKKAAINFSTGVITGLVLNELVYVRNRYREKDDEKSAMAQDGKKETFVKAYNIERIYRQCIQTKGLKKDNDKAKKSPANL